MPKPRPPKSYWSAINALYGNRIEDSLAQNQVYEPHEEGIGKSRHHEAKNHVESHCGKGENMGFPKRVDANQKDIVKLIRNMGASVLILSAVGKGCPDILVGINGLNTLVEIKDGDKPMSRTRLTTAEKLFHDEWRGEAVIIRCASDAIELVDRLKNTKRIYIDG